MISIDMQAKKKNVSYGVVRTKCFVLFSPAAQAAHHSVSVLVDLGTALFDSDALSLLQGFFCVPPDVLLFVPLLTVPYVLHTPVKSIDLNHFIIVMKSP